jgi:PAS domain S-box-containing protein
VNTPPTDQELQRLEALHRYQMLDTEPDAAFDDLCRLAAHVCAKPIAVISLLDGRRQWFKARQGLDLPEAPREHSFCDHTIRDAGLFLVADAAAEPRFRDSFLVRGPSQIRFYAGLPLITPDGFAVGTVSVMDRQPGDLTQAQIDALQILSRQVMAQLELRRHLQELARTAEEHRAIEVRLRTSEKFYQTLVETLPQNILRKDTQGRFTFANRKFCQSIGRELEEILGRSDFDLFPADLAAKYHRDDLRVITTQENLDTIEAHQGPHGEKLFVHVIKTPLFDPSGQVIGIQGIFWDVTQRKRIEEELAYERDLLRSLLDHIPDRIYFKDVYSRFMRCSRSMAARLGLGDPQEVVGKTDFDFHAPDLAREFFNDEQRILATGESLINKLERQVGPDGTEIWASVTKVPIYSQSGTVTGLVGLSRDITQLKQTEQALRQAEEKYRAIYENSVEGIFQTTRDGHFLSANPALARMYGFDSPQDLVGALTDIAHQLYVDPERREEFRKHIRLRGSVTGFESQIYQRDGSRIWISESARPVTDPQGNFLYYEGTVEDITARKTADLERERAREAALETARTKAQFLANMSHEIRTPMNAIIGMTDMLRDTKLSPEQREYVDTVHHSTDALLGIINDILDFSKMEAGKLTLEVIDFDLRDAVETTVEILAERAHKKDIELACSIAPDLPRSLRGDPIRLRQVLTNLASNAIKFTDSGEVLVRVALAASQAPTAPTAPTAQPAAPAAAGAAGAEALPTLRLRFEVNDTGIGISTESLQRIFQEFTQADGSTTRRYGGTGLGLTISKQLVEMMGGQIGVNSSPGAGSTFWFEIPLAPSTALSPGEATPATPPPAEWLEGLRLLLVDDTRSYRQILRGQLERPGLEILEAETGAAALSLVVEAQASERPIAVVIVDLDVDDGDGLALAQNIRNLPELAETRLVTLSTLLNRLPTTTMLATGISACLVKPVRQGRLLECLRDVLTLGPEASFASMTESADAAPPSHLAEAARHVRILLAEDNLVNQRVALKQLKKLGFSADAVANGIEVLSALQRVPYDIIIMDCQMPEMDGYEVTTRIRQGGNDSYIHLRAAPYIIALTANAMQGDRERCLALGMNDYLTKPLHLHQLETALQRALLKTRPTDGSGAGGAATTPPAMPLAGDAEGLDRSVIDGLKELREPGQPDPLAELIQLFFRDTSPRMDSMEQALGREDLAAVSAGAHSLKGSASNLGARQLASLCASLERQAKAGESAQAKETFLVVKQELKKVEGILRTEIDTIEN